MTCTADAGENRPQTAGDKGMPAGRRSRVRGPVGSSLKPFATLGAGGLLAMLVASCTGSKTTPAPAGMDPDVTALATWIGDHRDDVSLLAYTATEDGPRDVVALNDRAPRLLASTAKIVVLAAYAREVDAGRLDPDEAVPVADLDNWHLPGTHEGAPTAALASIGAKPGGTVRLDDVARAMIEFSDNTATDYLLDRLGPDVISDASREMGLSGQRLPLRQSLGATLAIADTSLGATPLERARRLAALPARERDRAEATLVATYRRDPEQLLAAFRDAVEQLGADEAGLATQLELAPLLVDWTGDAADYAHALEASAAGTLINAQTSEIVRRHLAAWAESADLAGGFSEAGGKDGLMPGIRTIAAHGVPTIGDYAGERRVVVVFLNQLDADTFISVMQSDALEKLTVGLAADREVAGYVQRLVESEGR